MSATMLTGALLLWIAVYIVIVVALHTGAAAHALPTAPPTQSDDRVALVGLFVAIATLVLVAGQIGLAVVQNWLSKKALGIVQTQTDILKSQDDRLKREQRRREEMLPQLDLWLDDIRPGNPPSVSARTRNVGSDEFTRSIIVTVRNTGVETAHSYLVELWMPYPLQVGRFFSVLEDAEAPVRRFEYDAERALRRIAFTSTVSLSHGEKRSLMGIQLQTMEPSAEEFVTTFFWRVTYQGYRYPSEDELGEVVVRLPPLATS